MKEIRKRSINPMKAPGSSKPEPDKAERRFDTWRDIRVFFEKNPDRLVDYIDSAMKRESVGIPCFHLNQLLEKIDVPLTLRGVVIDNEEISKHELVNPRRLGIYSNLREILETARAMFQPRFALP